MKTKIIYILVSDSSDFYLEQLFLSIYSLRKFNVDAHVSIIVDNNTNLYLDSAKLNIKSYVTDIIKVNTPDRFNKMERSRFIKTNLRKFVKGNFLFLDTDTIICSSLEEIDEIDDDISAVLDWHGISYYGDSAKWDNDNIYKVGWFECYESKRFNSGVLFVKDNQLTHRFFSSWYQTWYEGHKLGVNIDQLSLRKTNRDYDFLISELNGVWNCQAIIAESSVFFNDAKVIHYYNNTREKFLFNEESFLIKIRLTEGIPDGIKKQLEIPKSCFQTKYRLINGKDLAYMHSNLYDLYENYPSLYHKIDIIACFVIRFCRFFMVTIYKIYGS